MTYDFTQIFQKKLRTKKHSKSHLVMICFREIKKTTAETDIKKTFQQGKSFSLMPFHHHPFSTGLLNYNGGGSHVTNQTPNAGIYATDGFIVVPPGLDRFVKAWRFTRLKGATKVVCKTGSKELHMLHYLKNTNIYIYIIKH